MRRAAWLIGAALILVVGVTVGGLALLDDSADEPRHTKHAARAVTPTEPLPTTVPPPPPPPTTVTATVPPTAPPAVQSNGDDRLSNNSRLGYAGLGPIKLGMTYADIERVGQVTVIERTCGLALRPHPGSGLEPIRGPYGGSGTGVGGAAAFPLTNPRTIEVILVLHPSIYTISGVHVGSTADDVRRTYSHVVERGNFLTITNSEGRAVQFILENGFVYEIDVGITLEAIEGQRLC
jgi:hypothetical protein